MRFHSGLAAAPLLIVLADMAPAAQTNAPEAPKTAVRLETVAQGLENPWALVFLPDGRMLVTEKPGRLRVVETNGTLGEPIKGVPEVMSEGQGGLLDVALANDYAASGRIFLSYSEPRGKGENGTSVASAKLVLAADGGALEDLKVIFRQQPSYNGKLHFGSRIVVTPDDKLFVTVGERSDVKTRVEAQNPKNHLGKIIYITADGAPGADTPAHEGWDPLIWSIGHRNVQGAALDPATGKLWTHEHGPQGGDELNQPERGKNYGWPIIWGERTQAGLEPPLLLYTPACAPASAAFYTGDKPRAFKNNFFFGCLRGTRLIRVILDGRKVVRQENLLEGKFGRIREVGEGPDGFLYFSTSNRDGRGSPAANDDRILRLVPAG